MLEIEAKLQIDDPISTRAKIETAGAKWIARRFELNAFFDTADARLKSADTGLRLRTITDESTRLSTTVITYKAKPLAGPMKQREEIEFGVEDFEQAARLLGRLGFIPSLAFEKRREIWNLHDCVIVIDELPVLGHFVEVEGPSVDSIEAVIFRINLAEHPRIKKGYASLLADLIASGKANGPVVRF